MKPQIDLPSILKKIASLSALLEDMFRVHSCQIIIAVITNAFLVQLKNHIIRVAVNFQLSQIQHIKEEEMAQNLIH